MKKLSMVLLSLFLTLIFGVSITSAYRLETTENGAIFHWPANRFPIKYKVTDNPPIRADAFIPAVQRSYNTWQAVENATITFQYTGTTGVKSPAFDGENNIIMQNRVSGSDIIGQTYIFYNVDSGEILDADIVLNSSFHWGIDGAPDKMDVQNAVTHEIGHFCCLDDLYSDADREKTMYGYIDYGETKKRTLDPDDMAGLAAVYGQGSSESDDSGGGGSGCGTISSTHSGPGPRDINFLWLFLLLFFLWGHRLFSARRESSSP